MLDCLISILRVNRSMKKKTFSLEINVFKVCVGFGNANTCTMKTVCAKLQIH